MGICSIAILEGYIRFRFPAKYENKGLINKMVAITKQEKEAIQRRFPSAHIVRTMKQKSKRHHYFCEEACRVLAYLDELRVKARVGVTK